MNLKDEYIIRIGEDRELSKQVQEFAFSIGYKWPVGGDKFIKDYVHRSGLKSEISFYTKTKELLYGANDPNVYSLGELKKILNSKDLTINIGTEEGLKEKLQEEDRKKNEATPWTKTFNLMKYDKKPFLEHVFIDYETKMRSIAKFKSESLIFFDHEKLLNEFTKKEETKMHVNTLETRNFINGIDVKGMDVNAQVTLIKDTEKRIKELEGLSLSTKKIEAEKVRLKENLKRAIELFNNVTE